MTCSAFRAAGLHFYNDIVLARQMGTAPMLMRKTYNEGGAKVQPVRRRAAFCESLPAM